MKRYLCILATLIVVVGLQSQSARAQSDANWGWIFGRQDIRLVATGMAVGGGAAAAYFALRNEPIATRPPPGAAYALTTVWCAAAFPIVGTLVVQRHLTTREVYVGMANCVVPIVGGWVVEAAFRGQPWYEGVAAGR
jgi:hypothetical protein